MPFAIDGSSDFAPPAGADPLAAGGGAAAGFGARSAFSNKLAWQRDPPFSIQTRSQPTNGTFLPPTPPPRRRMIVLPSPPPLKVANDHSGSPLAAMIRTFTPSHFGAFQGSLVSSGPVGAPLDSSTGGGLSEPVT